MSNDTLVQVFLAVIALGAVLQAGFVVAVALGLRRVADQVDAFAEDYDRRILPTTEKLEDLTGALADYSDVAVDKARVLELKVSALADRLGHGVTRAAGAVEGKVDDVAAAMEEQLVPAPARRSGKMRLALTLLRRGLELVGR